MISINDAKNLFTKAHPELTILAIKSWDSEHYVLIAMKDPENKKEIDPYYGVDKKTGEITDFSPAGQYSKFFELFGVNKDGSEDDLKDLSAELKHSAIEDYGLLGLDW